MYNYKLYLEGLFAVQYISSFPQICQWKKSWHVANSFVLKNLFPKALVRKLYLKFCPFSVYFLFGV